MNALQFIAKTGSAPVDDDLDRVNCPDAGTVGHMCCGWCDDHDRPMYECGCRIRKCSNQDGERR